MCRASHIRRTNSRLRGTWPPASRIANLGYHSRTSVSSHKRIITVEFGSEIVAESSAAATEKVMFGAGCFWGVEHAFRQIDGVIDAPCGYAGGHTDKPTYRQVCGGDTGHAEVVEVAYEPDKVDFDQLLDAFWQMHDPTTPNRQGPDVGSQYRSAIYYNTQQQCAAAEASRDRWAAKFSRPIVTEIAAAETFYPAEEYHQRYFEKTGRAGCHI